MSTSTASRASFVAFVAVCIVLLWPVPTSAGESISQAQMAEATSVCLGTPLKVDPPNPAGMRVLRVGPIPLPGYLRVSRPAADQGLIPTLAFFDREGSQLAASKDACRIVGGSVYYIGVLNTTDAAWRAAVQLVVDFTYEFDPYELEEDSQSPARVGIGQVVRFGMCPGGDTDYFSVSVPGPGYLRFQRVEHPTVDASLSYSVSKGGTRLPGVDSFRVTEAGDYRVEVRERDGGQHFAALAVRVSFTPTAGARVPNDTPESASSLLPNQWHVMGRHGQGDTSYYTLALDGLSNVVFEAKSQDAGTTVQVALQNQPGVFLDVGLGDVLANLQGTQVVRVTASGGDLGSRLSFRARTYRQEDTHEPNDTPEDATPIDTDTLLSVILHPATDVDVFRLQMRDAGALYVQFVDAERHRTLRPGKTRPLKLNLRVDLLDAEMRKLTTFVDDWTREAGTGRRGVNIKRVHDVPAGSFFLRVSVEEPPHETRELRFKLRVWGAATVLEGPREGGVTLVPISVDKPDSDVSRQIESLARKAGTRSRAAEGSEALEETAGGAIEESQEESASLARRRELDTDAGVPWWLWLLASGCLILLLLARRRRKEA